MGADYTKLQLGSPLVRKMGNALSIARGLRKKAEEKKAAAQNVILKQQEATKAKRSLLKDQQAQEQARNKQIAAAGARGEIK